MPTLIQSLASRVASPVLRSTSDWAPITAPTSTLSRPCCTRWAGHGLGFQTFTNGLTGFQFGAVSNVGGVPSASDHFLLDNAANKLWAAMSNEERKASSLMPAGLSWTGARVTAAVPQVL